MLFFYDGGGIVNNHKQPYQEKQILRLTFIGRERNKI